MQQYWADMGEYLFCYKAYNYKRHIKLFEDNISMLIHTETLPVRRSLGHVL